MSGAPKPWPTRSPDREMEARIARLSKLDHLFRGKIATARKSMGASPLPGKAFSAEEDNTRQEEIVVDRDFDLRDQNVVCLENTSSSSLSTCALQSSSSRCPTKEQEESICGVLDTQDQATTSRNTLAEEREDEHHIKHNYNEVGDALRAEIRTSAHDEYVACPVPYEYAGDQEERTDEEGRYGAREQDILQTAEKDAILKNSPLRASSAVDFDDDIAFSELYKKNKSHEAATKSKGGQDHRGAKHTEEANKSKLNKERDRRKAKRHIQSATAVASSSPGRELFETPPSSATDAPENEGSDGLFPAAGGPVSKAVAAGTRSSPTALHINAPTATPRVAAAGAIGSTMSQFRNSLSLSLSGSARRGKGDDTSGSTSASFREGPLAENAMMSSRGSSSSTFLQQQQHAASFGEPPATGFFANFQLPKFSLWPATGAPAPAGTTANVFSPQESSTGSDSFSRSEAQNAVQPKHWQAKIQGVSPSPMLPFRTAGSPRVPPGIIGLQTQSASVASVAAPARVLPDPASSTSTGSPCGDQQAGGERQEFDENLDVDGNSFSEDLHANSFSEVSVSVAVEEHHKLPGTGVGGTVGANQQGSLVTAPPKMSILLPQGSPVPSSRVVPNLPVSTSVTASSASAMGGVGMSASSISQTSPRGVTTSSSSTAAMRGSPSGFATARGPASSSSKASKSSATARVIPQSARGPPTGGKPQVDVRRATVSKFPGVSMSPQQGKILPNFVPPSASSKGKRSANETWVPVFSGAGKKSPTKVGQQNPISRVGASPSVSSSGTGIGNGRTSKNTAKSNGVPLASTTAGNTSGSTRRANAATRGTAAARSASTASSVGKGSPRRQSFVSSSGGSVRGGGTGGTSSATGALPRSLSFNAGRPPSFSGNMSSQKATISTSSVAVTRVAAMAPFAKARPAGSNQQVLNRRATHHTGGPAKTPRDASLVEQKRGLQMRSHDVVRKTGEMPFAVTDITTAVSEQETNDDKRMDSTASLQVEEDDNDNAERPGETSAENLKPAPRSPSIPQERSLVQNAEGQTQDLPEANDIIKIGPTGNVSSQKQDDCSKNAVGGADAKAVGEAGVDKTDRSSKKMPQYGPKSLLNQAGFIRLDMIQHPGLSSTRQSSRETTCPQECETTSATGGSSSSSASVSSFAGVAPARPNNTTTSRPPFLTATASLMMGGNLGFAQASPRSSSSADGEASCTSSSESKQGTSCSSIARNDATATSDVYPCREAARNNIPSGLVPMKNGRGLSTTEARAPAVVTSKPGSPEEASGQLRLHCNIPPLLSPPVGLGHILKQMSKGSSLSGSASVTASKSTQSISASSPSICADKSRESDSKEEAGMSNHVSTTTRPPLSKLGGQFFLSSPRTDNAAGRTPFAAANHALNMTSPAGSLLFAKVSDLATGATLAGKQYIRAARGGAASFSVSADNYSAEHSAVSAGGHESPPTVSPFKTELEKPALIAASSVREEHLAGSEHPRDPPAASELSAGGGGKPQPTFEGHTEKVSLSLSGKNKNPLKDKDDAKQAASIANTASSSATTFSTRDNQKTAVPVSQPARDSSRRSADLVLVEDHFQPAAESLSAAFSRRRTSVERNRSTVGADNAMLRESSVSGRTPTRASAGGSVSTGAGKETGTGPATSSSTRGHSITSRSGGSATSSAMVNTRGGNSMNTGGMFSARGPNPYKGAFPPTTGNGRGGTASVAFSPPKRLNSVNRRVSAPLGARARSSERTPAIRVSIGAGPARGSTGAPLASARGVVVATRASPRRPHGDALANCNTNTSTLESAEEQGDDNKDDDVVALSLASDEEAERSDCADRDDDASRVTPLLSHGSRSPRKADEGTRIAQEEERQARLTGLPRSSFSVPGGASTNSAISRGSTTSSSGNPLNALNLTGGSTTVEKIKALEQDRIERRKRQDELREEKRLLAQKGEDPSMLEFKREIELFRQQMDASSSSTRGGAKSSPSKNLSRSTGQRRATIDSAHIWPAKRKVLVAVRKRPLAESESKQLDIVSCYDNVVYVHEARQGLGGSSHGRCLQRHEFPFDMVFSETSTNEQLFRSICAPLCQRALQVGASGTLFAYGQTGAGKTFSVAGSAGFITKKARPDRIPGLVQLTAELLFDSIDPEEMGISMSFVELYNGRLFDLLCSGDNSQSGERREIKLLEDAQNNVQVIGMTQCAVHSVHEVEQRLAGGAKVRATGENVQNDHSSRSHAILTLQLLQKGFSHASEGGDVRWRKYGKVTLVDLAGNERGHDTGYHACSRAKEEARNINSSLLALKECLRSLSTNGHVPFRQSKLTMLLRDSFIGENSITSMLACICPKLGAQQYILDTIRYAQRARM
ncbi:unnamed protein product [Amoebophrya sp. A25]|nr:unnamed protein product [Amoebophrya sp. A25]|eukprot:GSA25T00018675001.1